MSIVALQSLIPDIERSFIMQALNGKNGFINRMKGFGQLRNDPNANAESNMSPYLHFGQLSAQQMALEISKQKGKLKVQSTHKHLFKVSLWKDLSYVM